MKFYKNLLSSPPASSDTLLGAWKSSSLVSSSIDALIRCKKKVGSVVIDKVHYEVEGAVLNVKKKESNKRSKHDCDISKC